MITVAVTTASGATGYARRTVVSDFITGTTVLDVTDPSGDDNGPGTFAYPLSDNFKPGAFDVERFQVIVSGDNAVLRLRTRDLSPTFGSPLGAQLGRRLRARPGRRHRLDRPSVREPQLFDRRRLGVERPDRGPGVRQPRSSSTPPAESRHRVGDGRQASRYITMFVPLAALGSPGPGWKFAVVLHGQDGFSGDQARGFQPTPQDYQFGLCASPSVVSPICSIDPGTAPKAMDVIVPAGVDQSVELDPTQGQVRIGGVPVP